MDKLTKVQVQRKQRGGGAGSSPAGSQLPPRRRPDAPSAATIPLTRAERTLLRSLVLTVTELEPGHDCRYIVLGGSEPQRVGQEDGAFTCTCMAYFTSRQPCKHIVACLLERGHVATRAALHALMRRVLVDYRLAPRPAR